ncbi:MAG: carbohydrate ABC transporter permease [Lachnospiraceae bacterium]|nr:carbohydrate ABC transporter permease [Lachnospiraceae bacterium]
MDDVVGKGGIGLHARRVIAYIVLVFITLICLFWFYILFVNTSRSHAQIQHGFSAIPGTYLLKNWQSLMASTQPVWSGLRNSVFISACCAVLTVYFSTMTAYAVHVYHFKGRDVILTFILAVMMIPTQVTALGFYSLMNDWNLIDNFVPLIVPAVAAPAVFFYMKQYMESALPLEIIEASRIDGAGEFYTFNMMVIPIMKPAIAVQAIFAFVSNWNNYFLPALILTKAKMKTLPIMIAELRGADFLKFDMGQVYMMMTFAILPVIVVYIILSKHIVQGVALGSVKG